MTTASKNSKAAQIASDTKLIAGTQKFLSTIASFLLQGKTTTAADVVAILQARIEKAKALDTAGAAHKAAVLAEREEMAQTKSFVAAFKQAVRAMFGNAVETLAEFGLAPKKTGKTTAATKVASAAKSAATRAARGTRGTRQKAKIVGTVQGPIVVVPQVVGSTVEVGTAAPKVSGSNGNGSATAASNGLAESTGTPSASPQGTTGGAPPPHPAPSQ